MFDEESRYFNIKDITYTTPEGKEIKYKRRRFLPKGESMKLLVEVSVAEGERLDLIAARTIGDSEGFWRICDANDAMEPGELTEEPGRKLKVPVPEPEG